jgi:hypothetical protein
LLNLADLQNLLNVPGISNPDRLLLCLAVKPDQGLTTAEFLDTAKRAGWSQATKLNISLTVARSKGLAIKAAKHWKLTNDGKSHVAGRLAAQRGEVVPEQAKALRAHLQKLKGTETRAFVEEAVSCFERKLYRSAVVLSWIGAVSVIHEHLVAKKLAEFNAEALKRDAKWRNAKNADGLGRMGESDLLQVCQAISVIGKNVKEELEGCLRLRNGCGHPNSLKVAESRVAAHIETLMLNVFEVF